MEEAPIERRRILVAVDEGDESMYALSWCLKNIVSKNGQDTLILLYAKPVRNVFSSPIDGTGFVVTSDVAVAMERYGLELANCIMEKALKICKDVLNENVPLVSKVENGDPRDVICDMAEKLSTDIVVMGSHGYGLIKRAFLGSVSSHCAQNVKCPVVIVKKPKPNGGSKKE